jgi:hypothetical protein
VLKLASMQITEWRVVEISVIPGRA